MQALSSPNLNFIDCPDAQGIHRMAYWDWGKVDADHVILCVHGLTRQGRDFDVLARALCAANPNVRVLCPDVAGRGQSEC
jgi:pimeloyl-ACP methyl ester carboxylesterase